MKNFDKITIGTEVSILVDGIEDQVSVIKVSKTTLTTSRLVLSLNEELKPFHELSTYVDGVYKGLAKEVLTFTKTGELASWHKKIGMTGRIKSICIITN